MAPGAGFVLWLPMQLLHSQPLSEGCLVVQSQLQMIEWIHGECAGAKAKQASPRESCAFVEHCAVEAGCESDCCAGERQ